MSNFKVGEKVVCVRGANGLKEKEIYTIEYIDNCICGNCSFSIIEDAIKNKIDGTRCGCGKISWNKSLWDSSRFRKLDHQFSEDVIAEIIKQVKEESLTLSN
jgi:hypothetical protein